MRHASTFLAAIAMAAALVAAPGAGSTATAASSAERYDLCGRVFPDPHAYWPAAEQAPGRSPFAKGNAVCAPTDFVSYDAMVEGVSFLETLFPQFVEFHELERDFGDGSDCTSSTSSADLCSAGLPRQGVPNERVKSSLYLLRVTDERVSSKDKKYFVFPVGIHGIERAGVEAGVRAAEDLATWGACQAGTAPSAVDCTREGERGFALMETDPAGSVTAGDALARSVVYFAFANPDGWRRGDPENLARFYQRYNGNGVDLNRDWPTIGFTFRPYTPWSEPETRGFGEVLKSIKDRWDGGIDLHGQLIDDAFSFTMVGASERDYAKNQRILQTVKGAWADAEKRFAWASAYIKPNDAPESDPRMYGVQWGTVWDTIGYTTTGSLGDWIDSPLGLGADGIDNEMSFSHLSNCGTGTCYLTDFEQLHVDGNKSLIYGMVNFTLQPEDTTFDVPGKVAYVDDPRVLSNDGSKPAKSAHDPQDPVSGTLSLENDYTYEFEVFGRGRKQKKALNGGLEAKITTINLGGVGAGSLTSLVLERYRPDEETPQEEAGCGEPGDEWEEVNRYYNQSSIYLQSGQAVHANSPQAGRWRVCLSGGLVSDLAAAGISLPVDITFSEEQAWADPGQLAYSVTNMKLFEDLARHMQPGQLVAVDADDVLSGTVDLSQFTSVVVADSAFPGYTEPAATGDAQTVGERSGAPSEAIAKLPCAGEPSVNDAPPTCVGDVEFPVLADANNQQLTVSLDVPEEGLNDWDLYLQRKNQLTGGWFTVAQSATASGDERLNVLTPPDGDYRVRMLCWACTLPPDDLTIDFSGEYAGPALPPSTRTDEERDAWAAKLRAYAEGGGNLVLLDGGIRNLAYMGIVDRTKVNPFTVYAGFIGLTRDGATSTYDHPSGLAAELNQPGAARGDGFRHQTYEPVPLGFAIQNEDGGDFNGAPVWAVDRAAWEASAGAEGTVGVTTPDQVTLGELGLGQGRVRIVGALAPMPSEQYYHPFGLADYALTYSGYQVLNNVLRVP